MIDKERSERAAAANNVVFYKEEEEDDMPFEKAKDQQESTYDL